MAVYLTLFAMIRVEGSQLESRVENKMWLVRHLEILRQLMIDDLKVVKVGAGYLVNIIYS